MKKAALFIFILLLSSLLWAQSRYALIIGNANYPRAEDRLPNAINDTNDISTALRGLGFNVELKQNLERLDMVREISAFITRLRSDRNSEGFFWYAGHAMEIEGVNLLLPLDVNVENDELIRATSYSVTDLTRQLGEVRNKVNVVVLDACRVPPSSGGSRGIGDTSRVIKTVPLTLPDLLVIYSTAPGTVALDGAGRRNSPFAEAFLMNIRSTEPLLMMTGSVTSDTLSLTNQRQRPFTSGSMGRENSYYSLNPSGVSPTSSPSSVANNMVRINGGRFIMGSPSNEQERSTDEGQHWVTISAFFMGRYEVTQREYQEVMGTNPSEFKGDNLPVENVSWYDAIEYCNRRSQREGLTPAYTIDKTRRDPNNRNDDIDDNVKWIVTWNRNANGYRLPTEAEWEYACRAGTATVYNTGAGISDNTGWYQDNSGWTTHPVGQKPPNAWGMYDMHGNMSEWCWDWYDENYYDNSPSTDPLGASSGNFRVYRGGSYMVLAPGIRSAHRGLSFPPGGIFGTGFRIARNAQ